MLYRQSIMGSPWKHYFFWAKFVFMGHGWLFSNTVDDFPVINRPEIILSSDQFVDLGYLISVQQDLFFTCSIFIPELQNKLT